MVPQVTVTIRPHSSREASCHFGFADGNGRTGRQVLNLMLMEAGYRPVAIKYDASEILQLQYRSVLVTSHL